jgi:cytochrome c peroxidase
MTNSASRAIAFHCGETGREGFATAAQIPGHTAPSFWAYVMLVALAISAPISARARADGERNAATLGPHWAGQAMHDAARMRQPHTPSIEIAPPVIGGFERFRNPDGYSANFQPAGPTVTENQPFFMPLGTNGRTCQTCHQPSAGWTITPSRIQAAFRASAGTAPLFRPVDGAVCPSADTSSYRARTSAYGLVLNKGLIRVSIRLPELSSLQFSIVDVKDPYGCTTSPEFGLTSFGPDVPTQGSVSIYRRPLPTTNLRFLTAVMWDGREPSLGSQAVDAALIHFQAATAPTQEQVDQIVAFESGLYSAQVSGSDVGSLSDGGAQGGAITLAGQPFYVGINDPLGGNPNNVPFNPDAMTVFRAWEEQAALDRGKDNDRDSIARGEQLFNEKPITITGVAGLNDLPELETVKGSCTTCHDTPSVGNHSVKLPLNIGVVAPTVVGLDTDGLPVFTLRCEAGPLAGTTFRVTDPGKALISGQCADIGKTKGPILRNLAARAPYFHNGAAPDLEHVVTFYDTRFAIGFTDQEKQDLVAFLKSL